jgi:hypothetical protein
MCECANVEEMQISKFFLSWVLSLEKYVHIQDQDLKPSEGVLGTKLKSQELGTWNPPKESFGHNLKPKT